MQLRYFPRALRLARALQVPELSPVARARLQALAVWQETGDWRLATKVFGLSRATLYRWRGRYGPTDLTTLESHSRRPRQSWRGSVTSGSSIPVGGERSWRSSCTAKASRSPVRPLIGCSRGCARPGNSWSRPGEPSPLVAGPPPGPMRCANPVTMPSSTLAISFKSTRSMCGLCRASSSNSLPPAMSSPVGMSSRPMAAPPV